MFNQIFLTFYLDNYSLLQHLLWPKLNYLNWKIFDHLLYLYNSKPHMKWICLIHLIWQDKDLTIYFRYYGGEVRNMPSLRRIGSNFTYQPSWGLNLGAPSVTTYSGVFFYISLNTVLSIKEKQDIKFSLRLQTKLG